MKRVEVSESGLLRLAPGQFFGGARRTVRCDGVEVSHRVAEGSADEVLTHVHEDAHFILVTGGEYVSAAAGHPPADRPALIYNPPGTTHRDHFERGRGSFFAISLTPPYARGVLAGASTPEAPLHLTAQTQYAIAMRIAGLGGATAATGLSLEASCLELLGSMDRKARVEPRTAPPWLHAALELLHDRYGDRLTMADIAGSVGVHPIHLARTFRRHFRCSPGEFARYRRLERAIGLLARTFTPLSDVALSCGFADQSHFNRTFIRYLGLPPGEYRKLAGSGVASPRRFQIDKTCPLPWARLDAWAAAARQRARNRK